MSEKDAKYGREPKTAEMVESSVMVVADFVRFFACS